MSQTLTLRTEIQLNFFISLFTKVHITINIILKL